MATILEHFSEDELRHELRGFPSASIESMLTLKRDPDAGHLQSAVLHVLSFYLPKGVNAVLSDQPDTARLREDLGVDSLALSEAVFKLEELFRVRIETSEVSQIGSLGDLKAYATHKFLGRS